MYTIIDNQEIKNKIYKIKIKADLLVRHALPGQFVIVMTHEKSEKIPLTIYDYNKEEGTVSLIYQVVGASTYELSKEHTSLYSIVGPLGNPSELILNVEPLKDKSILFVGGGIGIASIYPQAKYLHERGIPLQILYGAKNEESLILEEELSSVCDQLIIATDDGSKGIKGFVTDAMKEMEEPFDYCVAIGPMVMMKNVSHLTQSLGIKQIVSLNPIMVDGTGMCGACRVEVGGKVKFACVDGPEFNGHQVNFDLAIKRLNVYQTLEGREYLRVLEGEEHHGGCGNCER